MPQPFVAIIRRPRKAQSPKDRAEDGPAHLTTGPHPLRSAGHRRTIAPQTSLDFGVSRRRRFQAVAGPKQRSFVAHMELNNAQLLAGNRYQGSLADHRAVLDGDLSDALAAFSEATSAVDSRENLRHRVRER